LSDLNCTLGALHLHPIKSCAGITLQDSLLVETGLEFDRAWMLVDAQGEMLTQRQHPRMALVQPTLRQHDLVLRAPGMLAMHLALDVVEAPTRVRVWQDIVKACDMGALAAQWFSDFLGVKGLRLVRFDPKQQRLSDPVWAGEIAAQNAFADGYPLLVISTASLEGLNQRLAAAGQAPVTMQRFRPNLVLGGLPDAHGEDFIDTLVIAAPEGPVTLKLVKPCTRCTVPDVDPLSGVPGHAVGDALAAYRADARMQGAITFGMNAVIVSGFEHTLRVGAAVSATIAF
jgi:uncharacterized protein